MITQYNKDGSFSKYIRISDIKKLNERIKYVTLGEVPEAERDYGGYTLILDDKDCLEDFIKTKLNNKLETILDPIHSSLYLLSCFVSTTDEGIKYLVDRGCEINRCNIFGDNALMQLIYNKNMPLDTKLETIQMLIDKGIDVNYPNGAYLTPLTNAINHYEIEIANLLIDNGGYILRPPAREDNTAEQSEEETISTTDKEEAPEDITDMN